MNVELISTGSELLNGRTVNRHAAVLGGLLQEFGLDLLSDTTVTDKLSLIASTLERALERSDVVFITGGLGPTSDDLTRDTVAHVARRPVVMDEKTLETVRTRYRRNGREITPQGERQALVVEGSRILDNSVGLAVGEELTIRDRTVFILPGPPRELQAMVDDHLRPWLKHQCPEAVQRPMKIYMITGTGESDVVAELEAAGFQDEHLDVSYRAAPGRVELCVRAQSDQADLDAADQCISATLGNRIFARERMSLEAAVARLLTQTKTSLSTAESCTGGMVSSRLTEIAGSSTWFRGGVVAYSNDLKQRLLGVPDSVLETYGAVSEETARAMAEGIRERAESDYSLSLTGIAGPGGGTDDKPVGLVYIGLSGPTETTVARHTFGGDRAMIRHRSTVQSLDHLRHALLAL